MHTEVLQLSGVSKSYPGVVALDRVEFSLAPGEIRGLVGQNGAGKSTLVRIIAGAESPDAGSVAFLGRVLPTSVVTHSSAGIATIYQEPNIVPELTTLENVFLGSPPARAGFVSFSTMRKGFSEVQGWLGCALDPDVPARTLSIAEWQMIEIARALRRESQLLILDEPTSSLSDTDRAHLFGVLRRLRDGGVTILYVTHFLDEVLSLCDAVTVMRDGRIVETSRTGDETKDSIIRKMTDGAYTPAAAQASRDLRRGDPPLLSVSGLTVGDRLSGIDFDVSGGEIVGIAGLVGAGRSELLRAIAGVEGPTTGQMKLQGRAVNWPRHPYQAAALGIGFVPEDRKGEGFIPSFTAAENSVSSGFDTVARLGFVRHGRIRAKAESALRRVAFKADRIGAVTKTLSGGNQQKVVVARALHRKPTVLLLDEPTRGVDVAAKKEIYAVINGLADQGMGVVVVSSEFEELIEMADRILVLAGGAFRAELRSEDATPDAILDICFGALNAEN